MNAVEKILRVQRLLSGMPARWTAGRGRKGSGVARREALARFVNPPRRGRPGRAFYAERNQLCLGLDL
jgi:hypothetical protein